MAARIDVVNMKNERYLWVAVFVIVIAVALYFRFYSTPSYQFTVSFNKTLLSGTFYPYQNVRAPIIVTDTGSSAISGLDIGLYINGNTQTVYKIDVPVEKSAVIPFNYTPSSPGTYNLSAIADPGKVFSISDRQSAQSNAGFVVSNSEPAAPYSYISRDGLTAGSYADLESSGVVTETFLYTNFTFSPLSFSNISSMNSFLYPITSVAGAYIKELSYSNGAYGSNSVSSIWIKGYLEPSIFAYAAAYKGLAYRNISVNGTEVTFIKLGNESTMCSWYSMGWIKIIGTEGGENCTNLIMDAPALHYAPGSKAVVFAANSLAASAQVIGTYSGFSANVFSYGKFLELNDSVHYVQESTNLTSPFLVCYGAIYNVYNTSFCSTYSLPRSGRIGPISLVATRAYLGSMNYTDFMLSNTSRLVYTVPEAIGVIRASSQNSSGSLRFLPGITSYCGFVQGFNCTSPAFSNSTITFGIKNIYNRSVSIYSGSCFAEAGSGIFTKLNYTLRPLESVNLSVGCNYFNGTRITGIPFNLYLGLSINYTEGNSSKQAEGSAYIV